VSDQENIKPDEENDVEAHKKKTLMASEGEAQDESTDDDDDVELHKKKTLMANDDDDVELHSRSRKLL
jgi:hypothetical protein